MFSQQLSPWESQRPSLTYIPLGGLSEYAPNGSYHGSAAATVISPQELQQYRDDCVEAPSPRPELHGIGTAHTFYSEGTGLLPGQGGPDHFVPHDEGLGPSIQNSRRVSIKAEEDMDDENDAEYDDDTGVDVDWSPGVENYGRGRRMPRRSTMSKIPATPTSKRSQRPPKVTAYHSGKPTKIMKKAPKASQSTAANSKNVLPCPHCSSAFPSDSTLKKHVLATHTRPFICTFHGYGCDSTVGSKNEWKRHINVQHMRLETWRCDIGACASVPNDPPPGRSHLSSQLPTPPVFGLSQDSPSDHHDFDRKDLFTQHMKRMHAPHNSASRADKQAFENGIDAAQMRCHLELRDAPSGIICPYCPDVTFESWDERIEHVGKHLEKEDIDTSREAEDFALREWMEQHGFIQWTRSAGWKLAETGKKKKRTPNIKLEEGEEDAEGEEE